MVLSFYNLREQPFGVTPDPKYMYLSPTHREALASLEYGISSGRGFLGLIAPPGMGKTTILFHLLQKLGKSIRTVFIFQTHITPRDFLRNLMRDLGLDDCGGDLIGMQAKLNEMLLEEAKSGKRVVVVVDEAQNLEDSVLEHLRMLSNFETTSEKLIQIVVAGQTQLADKLTSPSLVQLRQRIAMMGRLTPFNQEETERYISHRLEIAGYDRELPLFTRQALRWISEASGGIPRNINNICFNALSLGCVNQQRMIPSDTIREVIEDLDLRTVKKLPTPAVTMPVNLEAKARPAAKASSRPGIPRFAMAVLVLATAVLGISSFQRNEGVADSTPNDDPPRQNVATPRESTATPLSTLIVGVPVKNDTEGVPADAPHFDSSSGGSSTAHTINATNGSVGTKSIRVERDQTLYSIAMENLGVYNLEKLRAIQRLNPWLTNPDQIQTGQIIRIPQAELRQDKTSMHRELSAEAEKP